MFKDITVSRRHFEVCDLFCMYVYVCMYVCMYVCRTRFIAVVVFGRLSFQYLHINILYYINTIDHKLQRWKILHTRLGKCRRHVPSPPVRRQETVAPWFVTYVLHTHAVHINYIHLHAYIHIYIQG